MLLKCCGWGFHASLNREEDSGPCLHWASADCYICSALKTPPRDFHYRGSWVTSLHGNIFFWSEKYIYTINETNSPLNTPCVSPYLWHFAGNRIQGHHCFIFTLNMKRVQVCIDYYIIQICPNTGFIPALIYQTLHCPLPRFFNFSPPFFFQ